MFRTEETVSKSAYDRVKKEVQELQSRQAELQSQLQAQNRLAESNQNQLSNLLAESQRSNDMLKISNGVSVGAALIIMIIMIVMYSREKKKSKVLQFEIEELRAQQQGFSVPPPVILTGMEAGVPVTPMTTHILPPSYMASAAPPTVGPSTFHGIPISYEKMRG